MFSFCINTTVAQKATENTSENILIKGKISQNNENENNDPDPEFNASFLSPSKISVLKSGNNAKRLVEMENGLQAIKEVISNFIKEKYSFSLLSQHKYMITNCIGVKASAGEFSVQFSMPEINVNEVGKVVIKLSVNEISFNALKIRMRPCPKDLQCHFSERFQIGGLARDISMTVTMDPMAMIAASTGVCALAFQGSMPIRWNIGSLNLKPLQNNLDDVAKQMIEDALNGGFINVFTDRFLKIAKSVFPVYFEVCKAVYGSPDEIVDRVTGNKKNDDGNGSLEKRVEILEEKVKALENNSTGNTMNKTSNTSSSTENKKNEESSGRDSEKWVITPSGLKGAAGIVSINLPEGVEWDMVVKSSSDHALGRYYNQKTHTLIPGEYNIFLTYLPVMGVPIQKGMNTRLKAGILNVVTTGQWSIHDESKSKVYVSYYKPSKIGLPVGKYNIQLSGQYQAIEIKDGEVTEF